MGECFNGDPAYVGPYQGSLTGLFNYPMYFTIKDVFGNGNSCYDIRNRFNEEKSHFQDITALGVFVDNHDNARFLHNFQFANKKWENAWLFSVFAQGIPFTYYGSEQGFGGGNDPQNRETLWTTGYDRTNEFYKFIKAANMARSSSKAYEQGHVERYVSD
jgi:alpha-amylase